MKIAFAESKTTPKNGAIAAFVMAGRKYSASALSLDKATRGAVRRAVSAGRFDGKSGTVLSLVAPPQLPGAVLLLVGVGEPKQLSEANALSLGAKLWSEAHRAGAAELHVLADELPKAGLPLPELAASIGSGLRLRSYRFDKYKTKKKPEAKPSVRRVTIHVKGAAAARRAYVPRASLAEAVDFARDLVSEPPNVIYPETLADACRKLGPLGLKVEVLGERQMRRLGMGALLGVGQGSARESQLAVMRWNGGRTGDKPIAFVGKGVTFDTGGISIKPAGGMHEMKWDMGGSGAVIGLMHALAGRKAKVNAVGVVGLVENMPSGTAQRPGDIVTTMSGQTVEVLNTDAEGRLVLADALWYTQKRFKPRLMIDLATLTGAIIIALGHENAGLFSSDDKLAEQLRVAGEASGETLWRLPLGNAYDAMIDGGPADIRNIGRGRSAGSITAAQFLQRFTNKVPWAHLDIAGVAWSDSDRGPIASGATAFGVRLLDRFVADNYERSARKS